MHCALAFGLLGAFLAQAQVRVWQDSVSLPTYAEGEPDAPPQFTAFASQSGANYPYPYRSKISTAVQDRSTVAWRTLNIENEYLLCRVLPDLGGHLYNCQDKLSQREVFHQAAVVKKALIGQRGAWISTGIEPNFPVTHSRTSASPVNFAMRSEPGGAGSIFVSDTDRVTGLQWRVEYRLEPGVATLQQRVTLYNPTAVRAPYLWWNNAAIEWDDPGIRYIFPTHLVVSHGDANIETWPVSSAGVDMSRVENDVPETTWFALQSHEPFMAVYKPKFRSGVAHYADAGAVSGKKLWIMGRDQTDYYRGALTDGGNLYVEMQAGLFTDQETYAFLNPGQSRLFTEYWIPFRDLSGLTRATPDLLLYTAPSASSPLTLELGATRNLAGARIRILSGGQPVFTATADLDPHTVWKGSAPAGAQPPLAVQVLDSAGHVLLEHRDGGYDAGAASGVKIGPQKPVDWNAAATPELLLRRGDYNETLNQTPFARSDYASGAARFPEDRRFDLAAGRLDLSLARFEDALPKLTRAMSAASIDAETAYYAGVAASWNGQDEEARSRWSQVPLSSEFAPAARIQMAMLAARQGDYTRALNLTEALEADPGRAAYLAGIRAALLRRTGRKDAALAEIKRGLAWAPEDSFLRHQASLAGTEDPDLWSYLAADAERVLNIADEYMQMAMWDEAVASLEHDYTKDNPHFLEPGAVPPDESALAAYYRAYCKSMLKQDPAKDLGAAAKLGTLYQYARRVSSYAVLGAALSANSSDATAHALLGNLEMYSLRIEDAAADWDMAVTMNPKLDLERKELAQALALLPNRAKPAPSETSSPAPVAKAPAAAVPLPANGRAPADIAMEAMIRAASSQEPQTEVAVFRSPAFASDKQAAEVRNAYIEIQLQIVLALSAAGKCENLTNRIDKLGYEDTDIAFTLYGFGKWIRAAHFQYYLGAIESKCGHTKQAQKYWAAAAKLKEPPSSPELAYTLLASARMNPAEAKASPAAAPATPQPAESDEAGRFNRAVMLRLGGQEGQALSELSQVARGAKDPLIRYLASIELAHKLP
jgi:hypothetical protein